MPDSKLTGAEDSLQNRRKIGIDVVRLDPSKSSIKATPLGSPVALLLIGFGFGNIWANSPSTEMLEGLSVSITGILSKVRVIIGKSCSYLPFNPQIKFLIGSYPTSTFSLTTDWL